jgi:hypothetical protein
MERAMGAIVATPGSSTTTEAWDRPVPAVVPDTTLRSTTTGTYRPDPSYHPQLAGLTPGTAPQNGGGTSGPYALPPGSTLAQTAGGTQAQPFDVTLSQLATAVYGTRGDPPPGWNAVSDQMLSERGIADPTAWREQFLGGGSQTTEQEFKAEIYTDGNGNFVLSYRGTAEGAADWENNFEQGLGFQTDPVDKFSGTAVNTAMEFARVFGNTPANQDGDPTNLALTGHSQGGGLASVGSLASGIPAVTFDASGIHPNTLDRMGFAPEQARSYAENGGIRAYSLDSDMLSQAQESWVTGLVAPDALGTRIVVSPGPVAEHTLFGRGAADEFPEMSAGERAIWNSVVEAARHSGIPLVDGVGDLAYAAMSHNPNVLTAAMIEREPWQPGYENPSDLGRDLQDLLPEPLKDDYARNTHDLVSDIGDVVDTDFRNGDYVQGGFRILGDLSEGVFNSTGDTVNRGTESAASFVDEHVGGLPGDLLSGAISGSGDLTQGAIDLAGQGTELLADGAGTVAQGASDFVGWLAGR